MVRDNTPDKLSDEINHRITILVRLTGWAILSCMVIFLINNYLTFWHGWPGEGATLREGNYKNDISIIQAWLQISAYPISVFLVALYVSQTFNENLRNDSDRISNINTFIIRSAFFAVFYIGLADAFISFLRVLYPGNTFIS